MATILSGQPLDTTAAEAYDKYMVPNIQGPSAQLVVELADPRPGDRVLDVACGTGIGARLAARRVGPSGRVAGVDADAAMVEVAARLYENRSPSEWRCASAHQLPFAEGQFDLCLCLQGLQFFPDRLAALREMRRVLRPGGRLVASTWDALETNAAYHALVQCLERQEVDTAAARRSFSFGDASEILSTASGLGFSAVSLSRVESIGRFASVEAFVDAIANGSPSARFALAKLHHNLREMFMADLRQRLAPYTHPEGFSWPAPAHVLIAWR